MPLWSSAPPVPQTRIENNPTLLFSWWCTIFSAVIIITRLCGRKIRSNVLFREDWIMLVSLAPLLIRMALVHVVLIYGTNNVQTVGYTLTSTDVYHREIGSRLVLAARIFYAMFIWLSKLTVSEFLKRITIRIWRKSYELTLQGIRVFLFVTFFAVVVATLTGCRPFDHYWQVVPPPEPSCRLNYSNLLTMGTCDIVTDILLVAFPIPIVLRSGQTWKRKLQLAGLFSLSVIMIGVTATRMPKVISRHGRQQYRTVWASCEILASTAVSNAVILGSFLRDKGTKKNKFRSHSMTDSIERSAGRRPTITALQNVGSDEDLFRFLGCRVPDHLQDTNDLTPRPAPPALSAKQMARKDSGRHQGETELETFKANHDDSAEGRRTTTQEVGGPPSPRSGPPISMKQNMSLFDVGGLLEDSKTSLDSRSRSTTVVDSGASGTIAHDFASTPEQSRRGSRAFLTDIGGILTPPAGRNSNGHTYNKPHSDAQPSLHRYRSPPIGVLGPMIERQETQISLQDVGGLTTGGPDRGESLVEVLSSSPAPRPAVIRPPVDYDFQDVGGLLSNNHAPDTSVAALERASHRSSQKHQQPPNQHSAPHCQRGPDEMSLHDPGGLLQS